MDLGKFLFSIIFSLCALQVYSAPLDDLVTPAQAQRLHGASGLIVETQLRNNSVPVLLPQDAELRRLVTNARTSLNPNMLVESLYLYKKPKSFHTELGNWGAQRTAVFNQTVALGTLTGVQYQSSSRNEMRVFYDYSAVIDNPTSKKPLPDPAYSQPPSTLTLHARQRDLTFGDNIYQYDYLLTPTAVIFSQENVTALNYGIVPVIGKGKLRSVLAVIDCGDSILIYSVSMVNAFSVPGLKDRIGNSFSSRAEAIVKWFTGRLENEVFK